MAILFSSMLRDAGLGLEDVRLLRHQTPAAARGRTPYELWRDNLPAFERYQCHQSPRDRPKLARAPYWASFVGTADGGTLFVGLYRASYRGLLEAPSPMPHKQGIMLAGEWDVYELIAAEQLADLIGRLVIDWGEGTRSWIQRADGTDKRVLELRATFNEPAFPGFLDFTADLSGLDSLPATWKPVLTAARGVYLLTCPRTKELYVGKADSNGGFWQRWQEYRANGHGGNVGLRSREASDYQVSILQVAGTSDTPDDILRMEENWKRKLRSREIGLNRN
jgi:hypothetical protein